MIMFANLIAECRQMLEHEVAVKRAYDDERAMSVAANKKEMEKKAAASKAAAVNAIRQALEKKNLHPMVKSTLHRHLRHFGGSLSDGLGESLARKYWMWERRRYTKPSWRQKGLSTATNIAQGGDVVQATTHVQRHRAWGGETGSGVFASPGDAQTFHAAGGHRGKVAVGNKPGEVRVGTLRRRGKAEIYKGSN